MSSNDRDKYILGKIIKYCCEADATVKRRFIESEIEKTSRCWV